MTEKALVVQHNRIIEAQYRLSVGEQRLIKVLVSMIEPNDENFKVYQIAVIDMVKLLGLSDKDFYGKVKAWSKNLVSSPLIFKSENGDELQLTWLSSAEYKQAEGFVELEFSPKLKPFLLQLKKRFTAYELGNIIRLKRMYSIRLYELLKQYQKIGRRKFSLNDLRQLLCMKDGEYKGYKDFKRWVLAPSQKELHEKTDITFTWTEEKAWREVVAIEFIILAQARRQDSDSIHEAKNNKSLEESQGITIVGLQEVEKPNQALVAFLVELGVIKKAAESLVKEYPEERIKAAVAYTQAQQKEGKVKSAAGFLVEAVKNGYRDGQAEQRAEKEKAAQEARAREAHAKRWGRLKADYAAARNARFEEWRAGLGEGEEAGHRERFMEAFAPMLRKSKNIVEQAFAAYLRSFMPFPSLRDWAGRSGWNVAEFDAEIAQDERRAAGAG